MNDDTSSDVFSTYLPHDRRQVLTEGIDLPDRAIGSALFADLSGFTSVTEALARALGPQRGAEELTVQLNRVYAALIGEVERFGGSVVTFSGDAITCWFDARGPVASASAARRALTCALALQRAMGAFSVITLSTQASLPLALKVVVSSGPVRRYLIGQPAIQRIDTLAGETIARLDTGQHLTSKGEVLVDVFTMALLGDDLRIIARRSDSSDEFAVVAGLQDPSDPTPWPPMRVLGDGLTRPWLIPTIYDRLRAGLGEFLTELRAAVALFLRFARLDYDREPHAGERLDAYVRWIQDVLAHFGGTLLQVTIGDKGSYLYAAFGAPIAHEDDTRRAILAALVLRAPPTELAFAGAAQIGLSQGTIRAGTYGSPSRRTYGVIGDEVNLAARLMELATPGEVLVSERVYRTAADSFAWEPLPPITVKGKSEIVRAYRVLGAGDMTRSPSWHPGPAGLLIGRSAERARLADALTALRNGQGNRFVIEGEAGIGKSRLVADLFAQASEAGFATLIGNGDAIESTTPYFTWRSIFSQLYQLGSSGPIADEQRGQLLADVAADPKLIPLAPLLNAVLPLALPENELTAQLSGPVRADNTNNLLVHLLKVRLAGRPAVVALDDAHWLDSASWTLARWVTSRLSHLLLVIALRPPSEPIPADYRQLMNEPGLQLIRLELLSVEQSLALVCQTLGVTHLPEPVAVLIREKAGGHPFFAVELAYVLRDAGLIRIVHGECEVVASRSDLINQQFPDTLQGVISSRIDQLPATHQLALKVASVIGRAFSVRLLYDVYPVEVNPAHLKDYLSTLEQLDLTRLELPEPDLAYLFKHALTQSVAYNLLLFAQRRRLHAAVAGWYEQHLPEQHSPPASLLAHHWSQANVAAKAIDYLEQAGEQALTTGAYQETVASLTQALALVQREPMEINEARRARWERQLGVAQHALGQYDQAQTHLVRGLALAGNPLPSTPFGWLAGLAVQIAQQALYRAWPGRFPAVPHPGREVLLEGARACETLVEIYHHQGESIRAFGTIAYGLNLAERAGPSPELARHSATFGAAALFLPWKAGPISAAYLRRARATAQASGDEAALAWVLQISGHVHTWSGDWNEAAADFSQALEIGERLGDTRRKEEVLGLSGILAYCQGRFVESLRLHATNWQTALARGATLHEADELVSQAEALMALGRPDEAMQLIDLALKRLDDPSGIVNRMSAYGLLAQSHWRRAEPDAARRAADTALQLSRQVEATSLQARAGFRGMAEIYLRLWEQSDVADMGERKVLARSARQACRALSQLAKPYRALRTRAWLGQGLYAWLDGRPFKARHLWLQGLMLAEQLNMPYEIALAHYEIGRHLPASATDRRFHLRAAIALFEQLSTVYDLEQAHVAYRQTE